MLDNDWDVIIIGAGIHGAGLAQSAAAAGYRVCLLEQYDRPALGTSCKSSKLIHGGLRYLESAQFHLVKECLHERATLLRNAPHLVKLKQFHIPVYEHTSRRPWKIWIGLMLYTLFSRRGFHRIAQSQWHELDGLSMNELDAVFSYYDAQTDDAHLTQAVLTSAQSLGAEIHYGTTVRDAEYHSDGVTLRCDHADDAIEFRTRMVLNATGPWVDRVHNRLVNSNPDAKRSPEISLVQGAHILLPGNVSHPYYLESPHDQRAVFVLPWLQDSQDQIMVGTTETEFHGDPADVAATPEEIQYLLDAYNHYFERELDEGDVIRSFAGLRVLPAGTGGAFNKSRDTVFARDIEEHPRIISVLGGKLTAYRATAEKLIGQIRPMLPARKRIAHTEKLRLP